VVGFEVVSHFTSPDGQIQYYPTWVELVINLNHVALALNAAFNIVIYICKDKTFRSACADIAVPNCVKRRLEKRVSTTICLHLCTHVRPRHLFLADLCELASSPGRLSPAESSHPASALAQA